uniref:DUF115 domain-containing protein n=1 Tax=viral metagenome TaxID=1070528 RepID=A0A6M3M7B7_9ZZZZ
MTHFTALKDHGKGRKCLIVGGGLSVRNIDFEKVTDDFDIIGLNQHGQPIADIVFYYDLKIRDLFNTYDKAPAPIVISFRHACEGTKPVFNYYCKYSTHYYLYHDTAHGDIGFRALQMIDKHFGYSEIYLAGYDYSHDGISYHYEDERSPGVDIEMFDAFSVKSILPKYQLLEIRTPIYNCNSESKLTCFPFSGVLDK